MLAARSSHLRALPFIKRCKIHTTGKNTANCQELNNIQNLPARAYRPDVMRFYYTIRETCAQDRKTPQCKGRILEDSKKDRKSCERRTPNF